MSSIYNTPKICYNRLDNPKRIIFYRKEIMANVTRIKAKDSTSPKPLPKKPSKATKIVKKVETSSAKPKKSPKTSKTQKPMPKWLSVITWPFRIITKPFIALGRYIKASWREIRQVRWPNRKATWKMTGAILVYAALVLIIILLLDALFTFIFNNILGGA